MVLSSPCWKCLRKRDSKIAFFCERSHPVTAAAPALAADGMARAAARAVWTMFGGRHVEEAAEQSGTRTGDHGEPGEAAVGDG